METPGDFSEEPGSGWYIILGWLLKLFSRFRIFLERYTLTAQVVRLAALTFER